MDQQKTGALIRVLRLQRKLTQRELGRSVGVSDKAISKWERGLGCPDVSLLAGLARALEVDLDRLLAGELTSNRTDGGNMKRIRFYRCPQCGSIFTGSGQAQISCCGRPLEPLEPREADESHTLTLAPVEDELCLTAPHPMDKDHHLCFVAVAGLDRVTLIRLYPEQDAQLRLPQPRRGSRLYWCCTRHGMFTRTLP